MRRIWMLALVLALVLGCVPGANACGRRDGHHRRYTAVTEERCLHSCEGLPDEDGDGLCDSCGGQGETHCGDEDEDGLCDSCGKAWGDRKLGSCRKEHRAGSCGPRGARRGR